MSKVGSRKGSDPTVRDWSQASAAIATSNLPDFYSLSRTLDRVLWVLAAAKDCLGVRRLTPPEIASFMLDVLEVSIASTSVSQALRNAGGKVHVYHQGGTTRYEIMRAGKDHLLGIVPPNSVEMFYFEPGTRYSGKHVLSEKVIGELAGDLVIVDPYCGARTLDILRSAKGNKVRVLTTLARAKKGVVDQFKRELKDFRSEHPSIELRDYTGNDLHDRYILSPQHLVILGHSIKDLGSKESFAIVISRGMCEEISRTLSDTFETRWQKSTPL
jgi:hypothetical protein